jgi:hypothetical protein
MGYNYSLKQVPIEVEMMSDDSRVWIFQMDRMITDKEVYQAAEYLRLFTQEWTSHNRDLKAFATTFYNRFIVIFLDEQASSQASGCSIDNMTHHIKHLGQLLEVSVTDRENFCFLNPGGDIHTVHMHAVTSAFSEGFIDRESLVFDNLIKSKSQFFSSWLKPFQNSWHYRFL